MIFKSSLETRVIWTSQPTQCLPTIFRPSHFFLLLAPSPCYTAFPLFPLMLLACKTIRTLEKAVAVGHSLLEKFSGKFRRCWKILHRFSDSPKCYPCQGLGIFRQEKWLLENWPRLRERCWIFSSETAAAFLSFPETRLVLFFFPYNPHHPPSQQTPRPSHPKKLDFGPFRLHFGPVRVRLAPFGSVSGLFRVRFGSVSGRWVGSGWGRGEGLL